jgi:hypothetical protein
MVLRQGFLANQELKGVLAKEVYIPSKFTAGMYTHKTRNIALSLVVDNFGVKYVNQEDMDRLIATLLRDTRSKSTGKENIILV